MGGAECVELFIALTRGVGEPTYVWQNCFQRSPNLLLSKIPQLVCILALFTTPKLTPIQWQQIEMRVLQYLESQKQHKTMLVKSLVLKVCQVMQHELDNFGDTSLTELRMSFLMKMTTCKTSQLQYFTTNYHCLAKQYSYFYKLNHHLFTLCCAIFCLVCIQLHSNILNYAENVWIWKLILV